MHHADRENLDHEVLANEEGTSIPLHHIVRILRDYRAAMILSLVAVGIAYGILAAVAYLILPKREITTLPFHLDFNGASRSEYPNGLKFTPADITSPPVMLKVFNDNHVGEFASFSDFTSSVFILQQSQEYEALAYEYQAKLSDAKLTPVDRDRLEREYLLKLAAVDKSNYTINLMRTAGTARIPFTVARKVLNDVLTEWARGAAMEKHILEYRVPVLTDRILDRGLYERTDLVVALTILRNKANSVLWNIESLVKMPGIELVRTKNSKMSLAEVRLQLNDILRYRIEPLAATARTSGMIHDRASSLRILEAQLAYDQRLLSAAKMRQQAFLQAFASYSQEGSSKVDEAGAARTPTGAGRTTPSGTNETVMPQLSEGFLDRIIALTMRNGDQDYRQRMVDDIKKASLEIVPIETAVAYDQEVIADYRKQPAAAASPNAEQQLRAQWDETYDAVAKAVGEVNEIYLEGSRLNNPVTELFTLTGPYMTRTEHSISLARLILAGFVIILITIPVVVAFAVIHSRYRDEENESSDEVEHAASTV